MSAQDRDVCFLFGMLLCGFVLGYAASPKVLVLAPRDCMNMTIYADDKTMKPERGW